MKKVLGQAAVYIFGGFSIGILALLMILTYQALGRIFPNRPDNQIWGLVLFDIAALCWALAFVFHSRSTTQYAVSAVGFVTAFVGTLGMVAAEVMLSGANLPADQIAKIGQWMVYGFIGVTAIHAGLVYAHHAGAPDIAGQIEIGIGRGEIVTHAIKTAVKELDQEKAELARAIALDIKSQAKRELGLFEVEPTNPFVTKRTYEYPYQPGHEPEQSTIPHPIADKKPEDRAGYPDNYGPLWNNSANIAPTLDKYAWVCLHCGASHAAHIKTCSFCGKPRTNGSPVTAFSGNPPTKQLTPITKDKPAAAKSPFQPE